MSVRIMFRRGTAAEWASNNPVLASGEVGYETDTNKLKVGTGSLAWNSLNYITSAPVTSYDLSGEYTGTPTAGATIMKFVAARPFTMAGTAQFVCTSNVGSTAAVFTVNVNGSPKGTVSIEGGTTAGSGSITSTLLSAGQVVTVVATTPASVIDISYTIPGTV